MGWVYPSPARLVLKNMIFILFCPLYSFKRNVLEILIYSFKWNLFWRKNRKNLVRSDQQHSSIGLIITMDGTIDFSNLVVWVNVLLLEFFNHDHADSLVYISEYFSFKITLRKLIFVRKKSSCINFCWIHFRKSSWNFASFFCFFVFKHLSNAAIFRDSQI